LAKKIKEEIPNVALTTDIIVGFPNETYEQFLDTVSLCREVHYDSAFTFIYSPRNNTPAAKIKDNVSRSDKSKRFKELVKALEEDIEKHSENMVGKTYDVLVEGPSEKNPEMLSGYTEKNKLIHFKGNINLVGEIVKVKIVESHTYSMIGELVDE
jgi:tRNA-2-methylthio-N6-dimethylallyladenosine synthase